MTGTRGREEGGRPPRCPQPAGLQEGKGLAQQLRLAEKAVDAGNRRPSGGSLPRLGRRPHPGGMAQGWKVLVLIPTDCMHRARLMDQDNQMRLRMVTPLAKWHRARTQCP